MTNLLRDELVRMRGLFGSKTFWERPEEDRNNALAGLFHLYLNDPDLSDSDISMVTATLDEYSRRAAMMVMR